MLILTAHAIEQYCTRLAPGMAHAEAEELLQSELPRADRLKRKTPRGDAMWRLPCGACLVSKRDGVNDIIVTVLASPEGSMRRRSRVRDDMTLPEDEDEP